MDWDNYMQVQERGEKTNTPLKAEGMKSKEECPPKEGPSPDTMVTVNIRLMYLL